MFIEQAVRQFEIWTGEIGAARADGKNRTGGTELPEHEDKFTRRQLVGVMLAASAAAQTAPSIPANAADELDAARAQNRRAGDILAKVSLPADAEPAFHFNA